MVVITGNQTVAVQPTDSICVAVGVGVVVGAVAPVQVGVDLRRDNIAFARLEYDVDVYGVTRDFINKQLRCGVVGV